VRWGWCNAQSKPCVRENVFSRPGNSFSNFDENADPASATRAPIHNARASDVFFSAAAHKLEPTPGFEDAGFFPPRFFFPSIE